MAKAGTALCALNAVDLGVHVTREIVSRGHIKPEEVDEIIFGNVAQPMDAINIARVIAVKAGLPVDKPAFTVQRNCGSGMQSITSAADMIQAGRGSVVLAGGTESMSNIPLIFNRGYTDFISALWKSKRTADKLKALTKFRMSHLKPVVGIQQGLYDPLIGMMMGDTADLLAKEFNISRSDQDQFALRSHQLATRATREGLLAGEITGLDIPGDAPRHIVEDQGFRPDQSMEKLARLKPYFNLESGTVTVGNACPLTDGAAVLLLAGEEQVKKRGLKPLGYLTDYAYAATDPVHMGLGPTYATARLLARTNLTIRDMDLVEINEAFAAQVIANELAFDSDSFAQQHLHRSSRIGSIDRDKLNTMGGAIALGHPVGMTGTRLVLHTLKELVRTGKNRGLATLCIGGGQGAALLLEVE